MRYRSSVLERTFVLEICDRELGAKVEVEVG